MSVSRRALLTTAAGTAVAATSIAPPAQAAQRVPGHAAATLDATADYAVAKLRAVAPGVSGFPVGTKFEKWTYSQNGDWVGGFWPGTLWMAWLHSGEERFRTLALASAEKLAPRQDDTGTHDLGFLFYPSWVTAWRLTGDDKWRTGAIRAASSLVRRYNPKGRFIRAWGALNDPANAGRVIMDTMMNLDLLAFASGQTGDGKYLDIAVEHARTTQRNFPARTARPRMSTTSTRPPALPSARAPYRATARPPAGHAGRHGGSTDSPRSTAGPAGGNSSPPRASSPTSPWAR